MVTPVSARLSARLTAEAVGMKDSVGSGMAQRFSFERESPKPGVKPDSRQV
jgi:hypothetical protein